MKVLIGWRKEFTISRIDRIAARVARKVGPKFTGDPKNHGMCGDPLRGDSAIMKDLTYTLRDESLKLQDGDDEEAKLIMSSRIVKIARKILSKKDSPAGMFKQTFKDIREQSKKWKEEQAQKAGKILAQRVKKSLEDKGLEVKMKLSLGKYKGSRFVTSCKIWVKAKEEFVGEGDPRLDKLGNFLRKRFSPKFKMKSVKDGVAMFNIR